MQIVFTKGKDKADTMQFSRKDGSLSWTPLKRGMVLHDIIHYVVESKLHFTEGFFGLLAKGYNVDDFSSSKDNRPEALKAFNLPPEAIQAEYIVGLLQMEMADKKPYQNFLDILRDLCESRKTPFPEGLNSDKLEAIRRDANTLLKQWEALSPMEKLEVTLTLS